MTGRLAAQVAALAIITALGGAQAAYAQDGAVTAQRLEHEPDPAFVFDAYPPLALAQRIGGEATLLCVIPAAGVHRCELDNETPEGFGFGEAALSLVPAFAFLPRREGGVAVDSGALLPVVFEAPPGPPPAPIDAVALFGNLPRAEDHSGRAMLACAGRRDGRLDCVVEEETGPGLGQRALSIIGSAASGPRFDRGPFRYGARVAFTFAGPPAPARPAIWSRRPSASDVASAYPSRALDRGVSGRAELDCVVQADRRLSCSVLSETPAGLGFGAAALRLSARYEVSEAALAEPGSRPGEHILAPFSFQLDE